MSRRMIFRQVAATVLAAVMLLPGGCLRRDGNGGPVGDGALPLPAMADVMLASVPAVAPGSAWTRAYQGPVYTSAEATGARVAVLGAAVGGRRGRPRIEVVDARGTVLWTGDVGNPGQVAGGVNVAGTGGLVVIRLFEQGGKGSALVLDRDGKELWRGPFQGTGEVVSAPGGRRVLLLGQEQGAGRLLDGSGRPAGSLDVGAKARARFGPQGEWFVVIDAGGLRLHDAEGRKVAAPPLPAEPLRDAMPAARGERLLLTTAGADNAAYLVERSGRQVWRRLLEPGGGNQVALSADGEYAALSDVGARDALYLLRVATGQVLWRVAFGGDVAPRMVTRGVWVESERFVLVHVGITERGEEGYGEDHHLVLFDWRGAPVWKVFLGRNVDVEVGEGARFAVVTTNERIDAGGEMRNTVSLVRLEQFLRYATQGR